VPDQEVRENAPFAARHDPLEIMLDLRGVVVPRQAETLGKPPDVRIDDDALHHSPFGRDDVGDLSADAR
jgi:hypothetical protein